MVTDAQIGVALEAFDQKAGYSKIEKMRAALAAALSAADPVAWLYEDDLPENYPYDVMFKYSKVEGVRMFPVFAPLPSAQVQDVAGIRAQAIDDVLSALTAHELYQYRPKAFNGFIDYVRRTILPSTNPPALSE